MPCDKTYSESGILTISISFYSSPSLRWQPLQMDQGKRRSDRILPCELQQKELEPT